MDEQHNGLGAAANPAATETQATAMNASVLEQQLAKLQDALLEGRIDMAAYEKMKTDLLGVRTLQHETSAAVAPVQESASIPPPRPATTPWVKGVIFLQGRQGSADEDNFFEVYLDDQLLGQANQYEGINLEFETTTGSHLLKTRRGETQAFGKKYTHPFEITPIQFKEPGTYQITCRYKGFFKRMDAWCSGAYVAPNDFSVSRVGVGRVERSLPEQLGSLIGKLFRLLRGDRSNRPPHRNIHR